MSEKHAKIGVAARYLLGACVRGLVHSVGLCRRWSSHVHRYNTINSARKLFQTKTKIRPGKARKLCQGRRHFYTTHDDEERIHLIAWHTPDSDISKTFCERLLDTKLAGAEAVAAIPHRGVIVARLGVVQRQVTLGRSGQLLADLEANDTGTLLPRGS